MSQNTKTPFYLVQIYIIDLNINGNINNITKSLTSLHSNLYFYKSRKNTDKRSYMELREEQFIFGFSVLLYEIYIN